MKMLGATQVLSQLDCHASARLCGTALFWAQAAAVLWQGDKLHCSGCWDGWGGTCT